MANISAEVKASLALLEKIDTPEKATALTGKAKAAYLEALDVVHGPKAERAAAMGFSPDKVYHGTDFTGEIDAFRPSSKGILGPGVYVSGSPEKASVYGDVVYPLQTKHVDGVNVKSGGTGTSHQQVAIDPSSVRSVNAAFDPRFAKSPKILAGAAALPSGYSPTELLKKGYDAYQDNIVSPIANALKERLTPDVSVGGKNYKTSSGVSDTVLEQAADPVTYLPGGAGVIGGAVEGLGSAASSGAQQYAEGGQVDGFDPDAFMKGDYGHEGATQQAYQPSSVEAGMGGDAEAFDPDAYLKELKEEKYGTTGQMIKTAAEGAAEGIAGPLAPLAETKLLGVDPEDIRARAETNPGTHLAGNLAGFTAGAVTGTGEAALLSKLGNAAKVASGIGEATTAAKIGSTAVQMAVENAVMQSGDEVSKVILNDPDVSAQSAIANIGLAGAVGGVGGGALGSVSPLWKATLGPKFESGLSAVRGHLDGTAKTAMPGDLADAMTKLNMEADPLLKAALSGNKTAQEHLSTLRYGQNRKIEDAITKLHTDVSDGVMSGLGLNLEDAQMYSRNEAGHDLASTFTNEFKAKYAPQAEAMEARKAASAPIQTYDEERLTSYGQLVEKGMNTVGTDSPQYKLYNDWGNRLLAKDTIGGVDMLKTELNNEISKAYRAGDYNVSNALKDIKTHFSDFQDQMILKRSVELAGSEEGKGISEALKAERLSQNAGYAQFAKMSEELLDHVGGGNFKGAGSLISKIESITPETLVKKFSTKGNADIIPFLAEHFPETLEKVRKQDLLDLIKPAIVSAKGESPVNVAKLKGILDKTMAGNKDLAEFALGQEAIDKINAGDTILKSLPAHKDSGTTGGIFKKLGGIPASASATIAMLMGHNPVMTALTGHLAEMAGKEAPDAFRLAYLTYLGSDKAVSGPGMKAASGFINHVQQGAKLLDKAGKAVFVAGSQVIPDSRIPDAASRVKIDKLVASAQANPTSLMNDQSDDNHLGHYMPRHQIATATSTTQAISYLQTLKPKPFQASPLDRPVEPSKAEISRYNRALDIAHSPAVVLQHVKDGTLQPSDVQDLRMMYPALYRDMSAKLVSGMNSALATETHIPYKTRMGMSLFLGQAMDSTMTPAGIMAAQPHPQQPQQPQGPGGATKGISQKVGNGLMKMTKGYATPGQAAERDRGNRD